MPWRLWLEKARPRIVGLLSCRQLGSTLRLVAEPERPRARVFQSSDSSLTSLQVSLPRPPGPADPGPGHFEAHHDVKRFKLNLKSVPQDQLAAAKPLS